MQEFKIVGHIDLPEKKIRPEDFRSLLESEMSIIKNEVNEEVKCNFLNDKACIEMAENPDLAKDKKFVSDLENEWAEFLHKTPEEWRYSKDKNPASITEMVVTLILHRLLKERFIVARASSYDDYKHHVDNVLIDKKTGAVVCGFDEVIGYKGDDGGDKKDEKIKKILSYGGTSLKYGATIVDGKIKRQEFKNIPTFFLSLSKEELNSLLIDLKAKKPTSENGKILAHKLLSSLDEQYLEAKGVAVNQALKENLDKFADSLEVIRSLVNKE